MDEGAPLAQRRVAQGIVLVWALGVVLREPLQQAACVAAILFAAYLVARHRISVPPSWRPFLFSAVGLCAWQALSPAVALLTGASATWPPGARYGQAFEPLGTAAVATVALLGVPWRALAWTLGAGWLMSTAIATYQHLFGWPFEFPRWMKINTERVREDFAGDGAARYGAGGFHFHRLRFAHAAIALLGPALALVGRSVERGARVGAALLGVALLAGIWMSFARAAFGASLLVVAAGFVLFTQGWLRRAGLLAAVALVVLALSSAGWRERFVKAGANLFEGERRQAMTAGLMIWRDHPLVGVGFGNHRVHATALIEELAMPEHITHDAHILWITAMAETGLIGLGLYLAFHLTLGLLLLRRFRGGSDLAGGALLSFAGFHVLGLVHYLPFHSGVALSFYFVWGLGLVAPVREALSSARR